jgi:hypothetical protein
MRPRLFYDATCDGGPLGITRLKGTLAEVEKAFVTTTSNACHFSGGLPGVSF